MVVQPRQWRAHHRPKTGEGTAAATVRGTAAPSGGKSAAVIAQGTGAAATRDGAALRGLCLRGSGSGAREMFTVRRIVAGQGVERKFPVHSPKVEKIEVKRSSIVKRAKLYYLRDRVGKAVRLKERRK